MPEETTPLPGCADRNPQPRRLDVRPGIDVDGPGAGYQPRSCPDNPPPPSGGTRVEPPPATKSD
jgi:hypothetical protein